ncbi:MAG TPA: phosphopentomutase [bacterium]|nr:phosphopentomutase [bacterium]HOL47323.1 phosphopentomutase [bacterium]HPQ17973.1 phosphopentomutase [bacterium]
MKRAIIIVLDSVGIGAMPDAAEFLDEGANTLGNLAKAIGGLNLPNLEKLGLGNTGEILGVKPQKKFNGFCAKMKEKSVNKDTTTGHWEIAGLYIDFKFPTFPDGFPDEIIKPFEEQIGLKVLGNKAASGTEILKELGEEQQKTGRPIVYTSADSVFQIAAHEETTGLETLYKWCEIARKILVGKYSVGRVIARPFIGEPGNYQRTYNRKDYSVLPPSKTLLDIIKENKKEVVAIGKIEDIFAGQGITRSIHTEGNEDGINKTIEQIKNKFEGLIFTNLVDYDMVYGHRRDVNGYAKALKYFDGRLPEIINNMNDDDILFITADHGCDPTFTAHTDHTREYVFLCGWSKNIRQGVNLGLRESFADTAETILDFFNLPKIGNGKSFKNLIQ